MLLLEVLSLAVPTSLLAVGFAVGVVAIFPNIPVWVAMVVASGLILWLMYQFKEHGRRRGRLEKEVEPIEVPHPVNFRKLTNAKF